jgi:hypothetical protein
MPPASSRSENNLRKQSNISLENRVQVSSSFWNTCVSKGASEADIT